MVFFEGWGGWSSYPISLVFGVGGGVWGFGLTAWAVLAGSVTASACPLSCALFTSRAVRDLSEPIRESDGVRQRHTSLDKMTWNFWWYVSRTI